VGPSESVKLSRTQLIALASTAGLKLDAERAELLPCQTFLVFKRATEGAMNDVTYSPIGVIHSPFREQQGTPIQPA